MGKGVIKALLDCRRSEVARQTGSYPRSKAPLQRRPDDWASRIIFDMIIAGQDRGQH